MYNGNIHQGMLIEIYENKKGWMDVKVIHKVINGS